MRPAIRIWASASHRARPFPATQQQTESAISALFGAETTLAGDYCYGPLILNRDLIGLLPDLPDTLGWGWRFSVMGAAWCAGYALRLFTTEVPCPPDQQGNDLGERMHRMRQLVQNLEGVLSVLEARQPI